MNTQEKNQRLAELCGWKLIPSEIEPPFLSFWNPQGNFQGRYYWPECPASFPDYCNSLDAVAQAEAMLTEDQQLIYIQHLGHWWSVWKAVTAPASVRADALLLVLSTLSVDGEEKQS